MTTQISPSEPATATPQWARVPVPDTRAGWVERARQAAGLVAATAFDRDTAASVPVAEIQWIKDAGLIGLQGPKAHGGGDANWATVLDVVAEFAKVDGSVANILGWHYAYFWLFRSFGTPEQRAKWEAEVTTGRQLISGIANFRDRPISAVDEGATLLLNGSKQFNTGLPVSDRAFIGSALEGTEDVFFVYTDSRVPQITYGNDWDTLGQRSTASGSATVSGLRASWDQALGFSGKTFIPQAANITPGLTSQTLMPTFYVSLARGALDKAVDYIKNHGRAWLHSSYERAVDEPYIVDGIGQLQSRLLAAEALVRDASEKVSAALDAPNEITLEQRGDLAVLLSAAKTVAVEVGIEVTTKLFELTGGRSTARSFELDRFFRDLRTQSLHDPVAQKRLQVGAYLLRGEYPLAVDWYS
ncbi:MAG TPA: acyl-CoA dehydrogenase family protein [Streptosporangiaceae bacterium]